MAGVRLSAQVAAGWWAAKMSLTVPEQSAAIARFEAELAAWLDGEMERRESPIPLTTDYGPQLNVGECASRAGLKAGAVAWPIQVGMFVTEGCVYVHEGYNSLRQDLYP